VNVNFKIINAQDFIRANPSGEIDLARSKEVLSEIAAMASGPADYEILLDIREAYGNLSHSDLYELVAVLCRHRAAFRNKIAIIARDDIQFDRARFLELCASLDGFRIGAFLDFERAINWLYPSVDLSEGTEDEP